MTKGTIEWIIAIMNKNLPPEQDRKKLNQLPKEELVEMLIRQAIVIEERIYSGDRLEKGTRDWGLGRTSPLAPPA